MVYLKFVVPGRLFDLIWPTAVPALTGIGMLTNVLPVKIGGAVMLGYAIIAVMSLWITERRMRTKLSQLAESLGLEPADDDT